MTRRADFNAEDWATVVDGPIYAALRVIAASHGGRLRESLALGRAYQDARASHGESELLDELVKSPPAIDADEVRHAQSNIGAQFGRQGHQKRGGLRCAQCNGDGGFVGVEFS